VSVPSIYDVVVDKSGKAFIPHEPYYEWKHMYKAVGRLFIEEKNGEIVVRFVSDTDPDKLQKLYG
jgi:hypothetical protein